MNKTLLLVLMSCLGTGISHAQGPPHSRNRILIENYPDAPVQFRNLTVDSETDTGSEWVKVCVSFEAIADPQRPFTSLSYEVLDRDGRASVNGTTLRFQGRVPVCFSVSKDPAEEMTIIRPMLVEDAKTGNTVWESKANKELFRQLLRDVRSIRRQRPAPVPHP
jgi:hypothetical protein